MTLGVVVVSYGSSRLLEEHLAHLDLGELAGSEVVVVDNHTTLDEQDRVAALAERHGWRFVAPGANVGFGAGMNLGVACARAAGCTRFLLLNPDVDIDGSTVAQLVRVAGEQPLTMLTPRLVRPDGSVWFAGGQLDRWRGLTRSQPDERQQGPARWLTGACLLVDAELWQQLGGFDERYFLYWEDVDLSQRALAMGARLLVVHDAVATHRVGGTQTEDGKSPVYCRYMCRNRLVFAALNLPPGRRVRWLWHSPRYAGRVLRRHGGRMALRRPALVAAAAWGTLCGAGIVVRTFLADGFRVRRSAAR